jgi:diadenosine tetraphosphate (Ap4A) HIT family hydrolase
MKECPFCYDNIKDHVVAEQNSVVAIPDSYPVTDGHLLIVPKRHTEDYFSMNETEKKDTGVLIMKLKNRITERDHSVTGFNLNVAKVGGLQSQGVKAEAVVAYCDPLTTQNLKSSGFPAGEKTR